MNPSRDSTPPPSYTSRRAPSSYPRYTTQQNDEPNERTILVKYKRAPSPLQRLLWILIVGLSALNFFQLVSYQNSIDQPAYRDRIRREWEAEETRRKERLAREDAEREHVFQNRTLVLNRRQARIDDIERAMKEDRERKERAALSWAHLTMHERCHQYGSRVYHAELMNVPRLQDAQRWCMEMPIQIHGITYEKPGYCVVENKEERMRVFAYWTVTANEPTCMTSWNHLRDKGCQLPGSRQRIYEAMLWNHQSPWDNWREMCSTTPIQFGGYDFDRPTSCDNRGHQGIWGSWIIHDDEC